ncbi:MAG: 4Fe-4S dicluster domain-containing protein [Desulfuromonadales bacterium]|nr:4Fe-4S dicluster domain-containing protein [Desulfuromonadales bacterium]NIS39870.1 4Fe-4S dicluster domain-containing protein [Desulfuromonadales bacterium]
MEKIVIDESLCKGCALCTTACPKDLIKLSDKLNKLGFLPAVIADEDQQTCISCAMCAQICPDVAIQVFREDKKAKS